MLVREFILPTLTPSLQSVLGRLGYNPNRTEIDGSLRGQIEEMIRWAAPFIHPKANTTEVPVIKKEPGVTILEGGLRFESAKVSALLEKAVSVSLMACTIGNELKDQAVLASQAGEMTRAVILDAVASEAVEAFADHVSDILAREHLYRRLKPTMRFSPGYADLKTDIHDRMLPLLETQKIGISHHPGNFILTPEKSITALIGWTD